MWGGEPGRAAADLKASRSSADRAGRAEGPWGHLRRVTTIDYEARERVNRKIDYIDSFKVAVDLLGIFRLNIDSLRGLAGGGQRSPSRMVTGEDGMLVQCVGDHPRLVKA